MRVFSRDLNVGGEVVGVGWMAWVQKGVTHVPRVVYVRVVREG